LGMWHVWERGEMHTGFWWRDLRQSDLRIDRKVILKYTSKNRVGAHGLD